MKKLLRNKSLKLKRQKIKVKELPKYTLPAKKKKKKPTKMYTEKNF